MEDQGSQKDFSLLYHSVVITLIFMIIFQSIACLNPMYFLIVSNLSRKFSQVSSEELQSKFKVPENYSVFLNIYLIDII